MVIGVFSIDKQFAFDKTMEIIKENGEHVKLLYNSGGIIKTEQNTYEIIIGEYFETCGCRIDKAYVDMDLSIRTLHKLIYPLLWGHSTIPYQDRVCFIEK